MNTLTQTLATDCALPSPVPNASLRPAPHSATAPTPVRHRSFLHLFLLSLAAITTILLLGVAMLAASFLPGAEVRTLRRAAFAAQPDTWERRVEFGIGRVPAFLARHALHVAAPFLDLPPEVRTGLTSFHGADIGLYQRRADAPGDRPAPTIDSLRTAMEQIGWEPVVTVQDGHQRVAVFVPDSTAHPTSTRLQAAVFVLDRSDLVIVSARTDLQPIP